MRKSLILFALLLVLSLAVLAVGHGTVNAMQDDVTVTETTVAGDPAAAAGLTVALHTQYDNRLFWRTTYAAGTDPAPETAFQFSASRLSDVQSGRGYAYLVIGGLAYSMSTSGGEMDLTDDSDSMGPRLMLRPAADVATRTEAGETHTETVYLRDYYEYYGVDLECYLFVELDQEAFDALSDYFKIPVPEDMQVEVTVSKDPSGGVYEVECNCVDAFPWLSGDGLATDRGLYVGFYSEGDGGMDFSQIAGGYGVYFLPVEQTEQGSPRIAMDQIQNIYPMDQETERFVSMQERADGTQLLLFTLEQEQLVLTVLDQETLETVQRLELPTAQIPTVWQQDDLLVLRVYDTSSRLLVLPRESGTYRLWLDTPEYQFEDIWYSSPQFFFDGDRLAMAYFAGSYDTSSVCLTVYDQTGLAYAGEYSHNADTFDPNLYTNWSDALTLQ